MAASFVPSVSAGADTNETQTVDSAEFIVPVDDSDAGNRSDDTGDRINDTGDRSNDTGDRSNEILQSGVLLKSCQRI